MSVIFPVQLLYEPSARAILAKMFHQLVVTLLECVWSFRRLHVSFPQIAGRLAKGPLFPNFVCRHIYMHQSQ